MRPSFPEASETPPKLKPKALVFSPTLDSLQPNPAMEKGGERAAMGADQKGRGRISDTGARWILPLFLSLTLTSSTWICASCITGVGPSWPIGTAGLLLALGKRTSSCQNYVAGCSVFHAICWSKAINKDVCLSVVRASDTTSKHHNFIRVGL